MDEDDEDENFQYIQNPETHALLGGMTSSDWALVQTAVDRLREHMSEKHQKAVAEFEKGEEHGEVLQRQLGKATSFLVQKLCSVYLDLEFVPLQGFKPGDHKLVLNPLFHSRALDVFTSAEVRNTEFFKVPFLSMGPSLARSLLEVLKTQADSPMFLLSLTLRFNQQRLALTSTTAFGPWLLPPSESIARLDDLPQELIRIVLRDADVRELIKLRKINKTLKGYLDTGEFWRALLLRDFPTNLQHMPGYIELAPLSAGILKSLPLALTAIAPSSTARAQFLRCMEVTAQSMSMILHVAESVLADSRLTADYLYDHDETLGIVLSIGSYRITWVRRKQSKDDWSALHWRIDRENSLKASDLYVLCGQDRSCVSAYEDLLNHYETASRPWFDPSRTNAIVLQCFRQLVLKTDYRSLTFELKDFVRMARCLYLEAFLEPQHGSAIPFGYSPRLVGKMGNEDISISSSIDSVRISPLFAGLLFVTRGRQELVLSYL